MGFNVSHSLSATVNNRRFVDSENVPLDLLVTSFPLPYIIISPLAHSLSHSVILKKGVQCFPVPGVLAGVRVEWVCVLERVWGWE